jgi:hypothetical protein
MITQVIELLQSLEFKKGSENIEFAKGAYRYPRTLKETIKTAKRWLSRK